MPSLQYINTMNQIQLLVSLYHEIENKSLFLNIVTRFFFFTRKLFLLFAVQTNTVI